MKKIIFLLALVAILALNLASAVTIKAGYITVYVGQEEDISVKIENNENYDIEDISFALNFENLPLTSVGASSEDIDDINEDDDEKISFTIRPTSSAKPGDYNIPYTLTYVNSDTNEKFVKNGSFGISVGAKTELDFVVETRENPVVGKEGTISLEIINSGLGEIKSISVEVFPEGYELLSKEKVFVGTIDADDTDVATFDVIYQSASPILKAKITYKDFDNNDQTANVNLPFKVYSVEEAKKLGIIKENKAGIYVLGAIVLILVWFIWRRIRKNKKKNGMKK